MALTFLSRLQVALLSVGYTDIILRVKQVICLEALYLRKDLLAVLPTGYGKSLVFHVLPRLLKIRDTTLASQSSTCKSVVLVGVLSLLSRSRERTLGTRLTFHTTSGENRREKSARFSSVFSKFHLSYVD